MNTLPTGTVYGVLLNFRAECEAWAPRMPEPPYKGAPRAPVLYVKTANTRSASGGTVGVPAHVPQIEVGATLGMVMDAHSRVAGYRLMNDYTVPHDSYFRPPVKYKCLDGFLGVGPHVVPPEQAGDPARLSLEVRVNGELRQTVRFSDLMRDAARLLADVGEFMTLRAGDVLLLGCDANRPLVKPGDRVDVLCPQLPGLGTLTQTMVAA